jgi:AcrR family transcriptional regulator
MSIMSRREERRGERRACILQVASRFFLDHGYAGTTMSGIATQLGGSKGTLWSYFSSKEELFAACIEEKTETFRAELVSVLDPAVPLRQAVEGFCRRYIARIRLPLSIELYRLLVGESARAPEASRIFYERAPGVVEALLTGFLASHVEAGHLRDESPLDMAQVLMSMCTGISHQRLLLGQAHPGNATAPSSERIADLFFRMFGIEAAA